MARTRRNRVPTILPQRIERPLFYGGPDPITINKMEGLVANLRTLQNERFSRSIDADPRRNLDDECGYPKHEWTSEEYYDLMMNEPMAEIVNALYPLESWQVSPSVYEEEDAETATEWEEAWDAIPQMLGIEPSYHAEETGSILYSFLQTADILSGIGRHGVILLGLNDGKELSEPATPRKNQQLTFLRAFPEHQARVNQFQLDKSIPRYGWPTQYGIQFANPNSLNGGDLNEPTTTEYVHWSRVIHIMDDWHTASPSAMFALPRIRPVRNPVLDIRKVRGSSAEIYYKGGFGGHHFGTHPSLGGDVDVNVDDMRHMYEEYINGLQRGVFTSGMEVNPLAPDTTDPTPFILPHVEAIAMKMRCPKRKLIGNETGERATEDDKKSWNGIIQSRNYRYVTPRIVAPFANRLINLGVLPKPRDKGFRIWWPDIYAMSGMEQADILLKRTQAYSVYVSGGVEQMVPPLDYMTKFDNMEEEEAKAIIEAAEELAEEYAEENQQLADENELVPEVEGFKEPSPDPIEVAKAKASVVKNVFCATGDGGGIDPTCRVGGGIGSGTGQKRAAIGGELGPNGEWYPAGAFIATTDMPKKVKDKIAKAAGAKVQIEPYKWEVPEPGKISILDRFSAIGGAIAKNTPNEVNDTAIAYLGLDRQTVNDMAARYAKGERYIDVSERPDLMVFKHAASLIKAGLPLPVGSSVNLEIVAKNLGVTVDQLKTHEKITKNSEDEEEEDK